jgi:hypothetical protein
LENQLGSRTAFFEEGGFEIKVKEIEEYEIFYT